MGDAVSVRSAVRWALADHGLAGVVALVAVPLFLSDLLTASSTPWGLGLVLATLVTGYEFSVARAVVDEARGLPPVIAGLRSHVRRGISATLVVVAPAMVVWAVAFALLALLQAVGMSGVVDASAPLVLYALIALMPVLQVLALVFIGGRYAHFDRLRAGFDYRDVLGRSLRHWRSGLHAAGFPVAWGLGLVTLRYLVGQVVQAPGLRDSGAAAWSLLTGHASLDGFLVVAAVLAVSFLGAFGSVIGGVLIGQYSNVAYGRLGRVAAVGRTSAST